MPNRDVEVAKAGLLRDISDAIKGAIANGVLNTGMLPSSAVWTRRRAQHGGALSASTLRHHESKKNGAHERPRPQSW